MRAANVDTTPLEFDPMVDQRLEEYARARQVSYWKAWDLPAATQLLRHGLLQATRNVLMGALPGGIEGHLAHFGYVVRGRNGFERHRFTAVLIAMPESASWASRIVCHDRALARSEIENPEADAQVIQLDDEAVRLESELFGARYSLARDHDQDENHVWQLFSPAFMDWLVCQAPKGLSFELQDGSLCVFIPGVLADPPSLDRLCESAAEIARRVATEGSEEGGTRNAGALKVSDDREARVRAEFSAVSWAEPPADPKTAAKGYRSGFLISEHAWDLGCGAFFREFLRSRGMRPESIGSFRAAHVAGHTGSGLGAQPQDLTLPGEITDVGVGRPGGLPTDVYFLLTDFHGSDGIGWCVLAVDVDTEAPWSTRFPEASADAVARGLTVLSNGRTVCLFRQGRSRRKRTLRELESFLEDSVPEAARILAPLPVGG